MTRVYVDMVADLFHFGHVEFLHRARQCGDELVVGIHSDETVATYKRRPLMTMPERIAVVAGCRYVDEVVADAPLEVTREWLTELRIDLVVHGDDLDEATAQRMYAVPIAMGIYRTIPYTPGVSTSEVLERLRQRLAD
ncbi:MAG: adenylyltransferase/cytidyltransferase family protein [Acidimicrobiales bacterium]